jgi:pimeloyl-ACP methyl ester carboxylesterase
MTPAPNASREVKFNLNGGVIAGQEWKHGEPKKQVLLLHGWQDNSNSFCKLAQLLPKDWWLVAIDFPGHGLSSPRPDGAAYYVTDWISDVRLVIRSKKPKFVHLFASYPN